MTPSTLILIGFALMLLALAGAALAGPMRSRVRFMGAAVLLCLFNMTVAIAATS